MKPIFSFLLLLAFNFSDAQSIKILTSGTKTSLRGLSVVNDMVIWASGSNGTVARSTNGGETWTWITVKGFEKTDFRDIEAFDENTALIMAIAAPAYILKTTDAGNNWKMGYENKDTSMFLDARECWKEQSGIAIGDPIADTIFIARPFNVGETDHGI